MLNPDIKEFIEQMTRLNAIGCFLVPKRSFDDLIGWLNRANIIIGPDVWEGRATYYNVDKKTELGPIKPPAILVVLEEDYDYDKIFSQKIRDKAGYFMRVK